MDEMSKIKAYLNELNRLKNSETELSEEDIVRAKDFLLKNIEDLGNGNPIKAASKHYNALKFLNAKIDKFKDYKTVH